MTERTSARTGIKPRLERWASMLERYAERKWFTAGERLEVVKTAELLRKLSGMM